MSKDMFLHELNPVKGWWDEHALDKSGVAVLLAGQVINKGMVMSLRPDRKLQLGLDCNAMAIFAFNASYDLDALMEAGSMVGPSLGGGELVDGLIAASGPSMTGLVAVGGYELESTEFDTQYNASYIPNTPLTAGFPGTAEAGVIRPGTVFEDTICGMCSDGMITNEAQVAVVRFWGVWLPQTATCASESSQQLA